MRKLIAVYLLLLALAIPACRTSNAPQLDPICLSDGHGGCDGARPDGTAVYLSPSQMGQAHLWCAPASQVAVFMSWAFDTDVSVAAKQMVMIRNQIKANARVAY